MIVEEIISLIKEATGIQPTPFTTRSFPAINYNFYRSNSSNGVHTYRLQLTITSESYLAALETEKLINETLVSIGGENAILNTQIVANGGGALEDLETNATQVICYYDITTKL